MTRQPLHAYAFIGIIMLMMCGLVGCDNHRELYITEVTLDAVELYLDEPRGNAASLTDMTLEFANSLQESGSIPLEGTVQGNGFFVIFEDPGYAAGSPPQLASYFGTTGTVPGIRVGDGFFGTAMPGDAFTVRIHGRHNRGGIIDIIDDVVSFGPVNRRPDLGGSWIETRSLRNDFPTGVRSIQRQWTYVDDDNDPNTPNVPTKPIETNSEDDWKDRSNSLGRSTRE